MNRYTLRVFTLIVVSALVAILLASALNSFTRVADSALADNTLLLQGGGRAGDGGANAVRAAPGKNYLPIIFLNSATAGGAWLLSGNAGTVDGTDFLGTTDNVTFTIRVSNTVAYRIVPAYDTLYNSFAPNIIGGYGGNSVAPGVSDATISGGGHSGWDNIVNASYATIGGGEGNTASGPAATIGGGSQNITNGTSDTIGGGVLNTASNLYATVGGGNGNNGSGNGATIGGGWTNNASAYASTVGGGSGNNGSGSSATIGGGAVNTASGYYATVGGGDTNTASGKYATIPGGQFNSATLTDTFAAGNKAHAINQGAFVWGDSTNANVNSNANDQFIVRAAGGVKLVEGTSVFTPTYAALQVENATPFGEAAWLRLGSASNPVSVISLIKQTSGTGNFLQCWNENAGSDTSVCHINSAGTFVAGSDFAESLAVMGDKSAYAPGDLIALSPADTRTVVKSNGAYDSMLIGVYSTRPGVLGADRNGATVVGANEIPVALTGIVPVKVTLENGAINIGDPLTSSSRPGIAMRATQAGKIIGYSMESLSNDGIILALVQPGDFVPPAQLDALKQNSQLEARMSALEQSQAQTQDTSNALPISNDALFIGALVLCGFIVIGRRRA